MKTVPAILVKEVQKNKAIILINKTWKDCVFSRFKYKSSLNGDIASSRNLKEVYLFVSKIGAFESSFFVLLL